MTTENQSRTLLTLAGAAMAILVLMSTLANAVLRDGLVEYWALDGDYSANADPSHVGTLQTTGTGSGAFVLGKFGQGIDLRNSAGNQAYITIGGDENDFDFTGGSMSFSAWYTTKSLYAQYQCLLGKGENAAWRVARVTTSNANIKLSVSGASGNGQIDKQDGSWHHVVGTYDATSGTRLYVDGGLVGSTTAAYSLADVATAMQIGGNPQAAGRAWDGIIDDVAVWNRVLTADDVAAIWNGGAGASIGDLTGLGDSPKPQHPSPADKATDVGRNVVLSWTAGIYADTHDVYLGTVFEDVNDASRTDPREVLARQGQSESTYDPGRLEFGTIYYWRIDEVNAPPDSKIFKGKVWSFTAEPVAYRILNVQATASSRANTNTLPANMVNGSGLTLAADGQWVHGIDDKTMWQSAPSGLPATVVFEFDHTYKLHEMKVWNHNTSNEILFGLGAKEVTIEIADSNEGPWTPLADVTLTKAPGLPDTPATDTIPMLGVMARNVRLTIRNSQGGLATAGLAEVQFFYLPVAPRELAPADGTTLTEPEATLAWRSGREAAEHRVYLATEDKRALVEGSDPATLAATIPAAGPYASYTPTGLNLSQTYLWKITEVNVAEIPATHDSAILSFTTPQYLPIDDFESYKNEAFKEIWATWLDGTEFGTKDPTNGSIVGLDPAAGDYSAAPGRAGGQSLPIWFTNTAAAPKSEAVRTSALGDWTAHGIKSLSLWFYGDPANSGGQLYVKINNGAPIFYDGDPTDLAKAIWQPFNIDLSKVGGGVSNVTKLAIGVQDAGAKGVIRIDDMRLYPEPGELVVPTEPSADGLVAYLSFDESAGTTAADSSGNGNHGTVMGDAQRVTGKVGGALAFDGVDDIVAVTQNSGLPIYNNGTDNAYSVAMWVKGGPQNDMRVFSEGSTANNNPLLNMGTHNSATPTGQFAAYIRPDTGTPLNHPLSQAEPFDDTWHHIAWVDENGTARLYVDGHLDGGNFNYTRGTMALNTTSVGGILRATPSYFFTGQIDEVRIYNRALSQAEAAWLAGRRIPMHKPFE